jgi:hypothetical protein
LTQEEMHFWCVNITISNEAHILINLEQVATKTGRHIYLLIQEQNQLTKVDETRGSEVL